MLRRGRNGAVAIRNSLRWSKAAGEGHHHHQNQLLEPIQVSADRPLKWYACGPTVYDSAHLGHGRAYVCQDIIRRVLTDYFGYEVIFVMGVTDVDDKIIQRGKLSKQDPTQIARHYEKEFWEDMKALNVRSPTSVVRVTEHMDVIRDYVKQILENGLAYRADNGIYFDVTEFSKRFRYGKLSRDEGVQGAADDGGGGGMTEGGKKDPRDFALWKLAKPGEPSWEASWGAGRPGWHIECSAMTHHILGTRFDLHSGGIDLKFPHHNNEIAQCEAHSLKENEWVSTWIHTGHLYIKGLKMSKSLKNFITIRDCLASHHPDDFRLFCLQRHYWDYVNYSLESMQEARNIRSQFLELCANARGSQSVSDKEGQGVQSKRWGPLEFQLLEDIEQVKGKIDDALRHDFDTPEVIRLLQGLVSKGYGYLHQCKEGGKQPVREAVGNVAEVVENVLSMFGLTSVGGRRGDGLEKDKMASSSELAQALVDFRSKVRALALSSSADLLKQHVLELCDEFRDKDLVTVGLKIKDMGPGEASWILVEKQLKASSLPQQQQQQQPAKGTGGGGGGIGRPSSSQGKGNKRRWAGMQMKKEDIPAEELFKVGPYEGLFGQYDAQGIPTHGKEGKEISKTLRSKLEKKYRKHTSHLL